MAIAYRMSLYEIATSRSHIPLLDDSLFIVSKTQLSEPWVSNLFTYPTGITMYNAIKSSLLSSFKIHPGDSTVVLLPLRMFLGADLKNFRQVYLQLQNSKTVVFQVMKEWKLDDLKPKSCKSFGLYIIVWYLKGEGRS